MTTMPVFVPLHLGALHAYELALLLTLGFGPFVVLAIVVVVVRRRDIAEEAGPVPAPRRQRVEPAARAGTDADG